jgi:hypothetical protein
VAAPKPPPPPPIQQPRPSSSAACICRVCDRSYTSTSALEQHYRDTPVHPKCMRCNIGFVDDVAIRVVSPLLLSASYTHADIGQSMRPPSIVQLLRLQLRLRLQLQLQLQVPFPAAFVIRRTLLQACSSCTTVAHPCIRTARAVILGSWMMPQCGP